MADVRAGSRESQQIRKLCKDPEYSKHSILANTLVKAVIDVGRESVIWSFFFPLPIPFFGMRVGWCLWLQVFSA